MLKISVVLCTYNGEKYFKRTIRFYYKSDISYLSCGMAAIALK